MSTFNSTSTSTFTGTVTANTQSVTLNIPTKDKYVNRDIVVTVSARAGAISVAGGGLTAGTGTVSATNATVSSTNNSGVIIYGNSGTVSRAPITYSTTTSGWVSATSGTATNLNTTVTTSAAQVTQYLKGVSLTSPAAGQNTLTLTDPIGTWTWNVDSNGNVYIY